MFYSSMNIGEFLKNMWNLAIAIMINFAKVIAIIIIAVISF